MTFSNEVKGTGQLKLTGVESDINLKVFLSVRYTRESLPLHPPIRRIFSFNQNK